MDVLKYVNYYWNVELYPIYQVIRTEDHYTKLLSITELKKLSCYCIITQTETNMISMVENPCMHTFYHSCKEHYIFKTTLLLNLLSWSCRDYCKSEEMRQLLMDLSKTPSEKVSDLNQMLDKSIHTGCNKFVILASNLKRENQKLLGLVAARHKFKILTTFRYNPFFFCIFYCSIFSFRSKCEKVWYN